MPILKKPGQPTQSQQPKAPTPGKSPSSAQADPFAKKYASTEASEGGAWVPPEPGTYNALITEAQGVAEDQKTTAYLECTICDDGDMNSKSARIYFNFTKEDGSDASGMPYFKSAMTMLGRTDDFKSWDEMCEFLAEIAAEQVWVIIDVKKKGKYTNIFLSSVPEDQNEKPSFE